MVSPVAPFETVSAVQLPTRWYWWPEVAEYTSISDIVALRWTKISIKPLNYLIGGCWSCFQNRGLKVLGACRATWFNKFEIRNNNITRENVCFDINKEGNERAVNFEFQYLFYCLNVALINCAFIISKSKWSVSKIWKEVSIVTLVLTTNIFVQL